MFNLLLAVASSALVSITMRLSETRVKNNTAMLAVNYIMCSLLAWGYTGFASLWPQEPGSLWSISHTSSPASPRDR